MSATRSSTLVALRMRGDRQRAAVGHRVHGIQHQIRERAVQQLRIGIERHRRIGDVNCKSESSRRSCAWLDGSLRKAQRTRSTTSFASIRSSSGFGILLKSLKRPMIVFRFAISVASVAVLSRKTSSNSAAGRFARTHQILDRELQREERILELVRQPARQFAPCGHALALHQAVALARQLLRHVIEAARQHAHLVAPALRHAHIPIAAGHLLGRMRQLLDGPRDARRNPEAERDGQQNAARRHAIGDGANVLLRLDHAAARDGHHQHRHHVALLVLERDRRRVQAVFAPASRIDDAAHLLAGFARGVDQALDSGSRRRMRRWRRAAAQDRKPPEREHSLPCAKFTVVVALLASL